MKIGNIKFKGMHGLFKKKGLLFIQGYGVVSDPVFLWVCKEWFLLKLFGNGGFLAISSLECKALCS